MKVNIRWILGGLLAFVVFAIATLPAVQVIGRITLPNNVSISGVSGTIWQGSAQTLVVDGLPINNITWDVSVWSLLVGNLSADLKGGNLRDTDAIAFTGPVSLSLFNLEQINSEDFLLYLPVDRVLAKVQLPLPVYASGRFKVELNNLSYGPTCIALQGKGNWLNATVAGTQGPIDFGMYSATLRCQGDSIGVTVSEPNLLGLSMDAVVSADFRNIKVSGRFKPDESLPAEVHSIAAAGFFGQPNSSGYYTVQL